MADDTQHRSKDTARGDLSAALDVMGTRCAMQLVLEASRGTRRFDTFVERTRISEAVVAGRLRALVDAGVLERRPYKEPGQRTRSEYELTPAGQELLPIVHGLARWGAARRDDAPTTA
jgi:DNA-binding HxlR family transcriptional regulator